MDIKIQKVGKIFIDPATGSETEALSEISLCIRQNEFVTLLGPSGCGKTTLLNLMAGFDFPTTGYVLVGDQPISGPSPDRGVIFQAPNLFPWLSTLDNVLFGPRVRGENLVEARLRAKELLELVGLEGFERHRPHELSGGMQQRVAIARVLMNHPAILLADEPFAALDEYTRRAMQDEFLRIWQQTETTVVFVTHNIEEALYLADRVVVMSKHPGRVKEVLSMDMPRPRDRTSPAFFKYVSTALQLIQPDIVSEGHARSR